MITDTALRDGLELMQHVLASPSYNRSMIQETIKQYHRLAISMFPAAAEAALEARAENARLRATRTEAERERDAAVANIKTMRRIWISVEDERDVHKAKLNAALAQVMVLRTALVALLDHAADIGEVPADKCGICAKARALLAEPSQGSAT